MEGTRRYSFQPPKHAGRAAHAVHFLSALYIDLAEVESQSLRLIIARRLGADRLVDDPVQFFQQVGHVRRVAPLGQLLVDRLDIVMPLGIGEYRRLGQERLEADEHLSSEDLKPSLGFVIGIGGLDRILQTLNSCETGGTD